MRRGSELLRNATVRQRAGPTPSVHLLEKPFAVAS
jgi:hypothetical protein